MELGRILNRELFLHLLDLEVKRAMRYQNFFCLLCLKVSPVANHQNGRSLQQFFEALTHWVRRGLRESDILGSLGNYQVAALLPYADVSAGCSARSRFERNLEEFNFKGGFQLSITQVCFPNDATETADLVRKMTIGAAA